MLTNKKAKLYIQKKITSNTLKQTKNGKYHTLLTHTSATHTELQSLAHGLNTASLTRQKSHVLHPIVERTTIVSLSTIIFSISFICNSPMCIKRQKKQV